MVMNTHIIMYSKQNCGLCDQAKYILDILCDKYQLSYQVIDIYTDDDLLERFQLMIPVVEIKGEVIESGKISISKLDRYFKEFVV